jgi:hypothetical protein
VTLLNILSIENLDKIKVPYRIFRVKGIVPDDDYDKNVQILSDKLSRLTESPCMAVRQNDSLYIVQPLDSRDPPSRYPVVGAEAIIEPTGTEKTLAYGSLDEESARIAVRFLQFYLNGHFHDIPSLWSPGTGKPYFRKEPFEGFRSDEAAVYRGFKIRLVLLPRNKIGVCVDVTRMYASREYLPSQIDANLIRQLKYKKCIYEFGNLWYEIAIDGVSGLNVSEERVDDVTLYDYIHSTCRGPKPQALVSLPKDCAVLTYRTGLNQIKRTPSALCRLTLSTNHPAVAEYHRKTILRPWDRRAEIEWVTQTYLANWSFNGTPIALSKKMLDIKCNRLAPPELEFGQNKVLGVSDKPGVLAVPLREFPKMKQQLLYSSMAGFYSQKGVDRQYIIMPKSMRETFGESYLGDLTQYTHWVPKYYALRRKASSLHSASTPGTG